MMVIMQEGATAEQVAHVVTRVEEVGASAHVSTGERVTVIGVIGDREDLTSLPIEAMDGVDRVVAILKPYKLVSREFQPARHRHRGARRAGSAAATSRSSPARARSRRRSRCSRRPRAVKAAGATMLRGGAFKPRTSPYAFQGLGEEGLKMLAAARDDTGLPIVTEVLDPRDLDVVCELRRHAPDRRPQHAELPAARRGRQGRQAGAAQARPLGDHRGVAHGGRVRAQGGQPRASSSASAASAPSRPPRATRSTSPPCPVIKLASHLPVIVDPSHAAGRRDLVAPLSLAGVAAGADGLIVEVAPQPGARALRRAAVAPHGRVRRVRRPRAASWPAGRARPSSDVSEPGFRGGTLAVIGVGFMGGSLGLAGRARAGVGEVVGCSRSRETVDLALERGAITRARREHRRGGGGGRPRGRRLARAPRRRAREGGPARLSAARRGHGRRQYQGPADAGPHAGRAGTLHRRAPPLRLGGGRRGQRAHLALRRRHVLSHARRSRRRRGLSAPARVRH